MRNSLTPRAKAIGEAIQKRIDGVAKTTGLQEAADFISSNWTMGSLTLLPEVARQYITDIVDQTGFLKTCRQFTTTKLSLNMNVYQIQERKSYRPTVLTASTTAQRAVVSNVGLEATLKRMATTAYIDYDAIEDNADKGTDFVVRLVEDMLIRQRSNDEADLAMNGTTDTWVAATFLTNNVGFPQLAKSNTSVYKAFTGSTLSTKIGILEAMWDELPAKRKTRPGLVYILNINNAAEYRREIGAKEGMGYVFVTGNANQSEGIPIVIGDFQPEDFYFLGRPGEDFGVFHNLRMQVSMKNEVEQSAIKAVLNQSIDFQYVNPEQLCVAYAGTPSDVTLSPTATTFGTAGLAITLTRDTYNEDQNTTIYYTTNGSTPDTSDGTLYSAAFTLTATSVVKARTYKNGVTGTTVTATYTSS